MKKNVLIVISIVLLSIPAVWSLLQQGFFVSDDGEWMIIRFSSFYQALKDGQFPVRFLSTLNYGYGYPVANFLYPGFMYLGVPIHVFGFGFADTVKTILGLSIVGSAIFSFLWLGRLFDKRAAVVGALFYVYTPYHLYDLYTRGSVGEILALAVVPFVLWQFERKSFVWSSLGFAFLILSHNTLAILFFGLFIVYAAVEYFISKNKKDIIKFYSSTFLFGFLASSFFWIPAIFELNYTIFSQTAVSNWSVYFSSYELIGWSVMFIFILVGYIFFSRRIVIPKYKLYLTFLIVGALSLFFSVSLSSIFWNILPVSFIQFPFRLLSITILCASFLAALFISLVKNEKRKLIVSIALLVIAGASSWNYMFVGGHFNKGDDFYSTNQDTTTVKDEYMPVWVKEKPKERFEQKLEVLEGTVTEYEVSYNANSVQFQINALSPSRIRINTIYYPGWQAIVGGQKVEIDYSNEKGVMELALPAGKHTGTMKFSETPLRLFADGVSIFALLIIVILIMRKNLYPIVIGHR